MAVIGSGPAGLAAAAQLNKVGHLVTVFERNNAVGGLLRYGIPTMKLSKEVVQRRVDLMATEGIEFRTNVEVGRDIDANSLYAQYDAILLATGATWPRDLNIPGRQLNGIHFAMSFLQGWQSQQTGPTGAEKSNLDELVKLAKGKRVLIVGGGDTATDCIGTSLRQGAKDIITFEILPKPPNSRAVDNRWPTWPKVFKLDYGHEETLLLMNKDPRIFQIQSKEFLDDGHGNVSGVSTVQIEWKKDAQGRWQIVEIPGTEKVYECELVLLAMGFLGPEEVVIKQLGLRKDSRSNVETPEGKYNTSVPKIYASGGKLFFIVKLLVLTCKMFILFQKKIRLPKRSKLGCMGHKRGKTGGQTDRLRFDGIFVAGRTSRSGSFGIARSSLVYQSWRVVHVALRLFFSVHIFFSYFFVTLIVYYHYIIRTFTESVFLFNNILLINNILVFKENQ